MNLKINRISAKVLIELSTWVCVRVTGHLVRGTFFYLGCAFVLKKMNPFFSRIYFEFWELNRVVHRIFAKTFHPFNKIVISINTIQCEMNFDLIYFSVEYSHEKFDINFGVLNFETEMIVTIYNHAVACYTLSSNTIDACTLVELVCIQSTGVNSYLR